MGSRGQATPLEFFSNLSLENRLRFELNPGCWPQEYDMLTLITRQLQILKTINNKKVDIHTGLLSESDSSKLSSSTGTLRRFKRWSPRFCFLNSTDISFLCLRIVCQTNTWSK